MNACYGRSRAQVSLCRQVSGPFRQFFVSTAYVYQIVGKAWSHLVGRGKLGFDQKLPRHLQRYFGVSIVAYLVL